MTTHGQTLHDLTSGCRLHVSKLGTRRALEEEQVEVIADQFNATNRSLSASKRLINTKHKSWRAVNDVLQAAKSYWLACTLPYVEPGTRLLRRDRAPEFTAHIDELSGKLVEAVEDLNGCREELLEHARAELGTLFDASDFPQRFDACFAITCDFVSVDPPAYLQQLAPEVYERECQRVQAAFDQAVLIAENSFAQDMLGLVTRLNNSLQPGPEGSKKRIHESGLEGLREFTQRFRSLSVGSNAQLEELVAQCESLIEGKDIKAVRTDGALRHEMSGTLAEVSERLAGLVVAAPERRLRTRVKPQGEEVAA